MKSLNERFGLQGRVALVTGASEGIGRDLALALAHAGADVIVSSRREAELKKVKAEIEAIGRKSAFYVLDLCHIQAMASLRDFIRDTFGRLDILVNGAGFVVTKPAWEVTEQDWNNMVDVGFKGLFFSCQVFGEMMRERGYGKIINLSSTFSRSASKGRAVYSGIKAGVSHMTEALALEWAPDGIRVNALAPTAVKTPARDDISGDRLMAILARIPLGRLATTDDMVGAAVYLASEASDFVTGHTLFVDGGWIAGS